MAVFLDQQREFHRRIINDLLDACPGINSVGAAINRVDAEARINRSFVGSERQWLKALLSDPIFRMFINQATKLLPSIQGHRFANVDCISRIGKGGLQ